MRRCRSVRLPAIAGALALAVAACGDGATGPSVTGPGATPTEQLAFTAPAVGGGTVDVDVAATGPTVFWFWAPG